MAKVFISYSREDTAIASRLYYDLKKSGLDPWLDREDLLPGQQWRPAIRAAIKNASHFIALLSSSTEGRGFQNAELYEALDIVREFPPSEIFLIPARIHDCRPSHEQLRDINWVDLFPVYWSGVEKIILTIKSSQRPPAGASLKSGSADGSPGSLAEADSTMPLAQPFHALNPGALFAERYRIEELVGQGGMGLVYRVTDTSTGQLAALKILGSAAAREKDFSERFAREIQVLARLSHPCIPKIVAAGIAEAPFFVADYIRGKSLRRVIDETGSLSAERTAAIGAAVADALAAAHSQGIIHRDIKPHNIMLRDDGAVFLIDFGIARATGLDMRSLTQTGMLLGTPHYPPVALGNPLGTWKARQGGRLLLSERLR